MSENKVWNPNEKISIEKLRSSLKGNYEILPKGTYQFKVDSAKLIAKGSSLKLPPCQHIEIILSISTSKITYDLPLCDSMTWKYSGFYFSVIDTDEELSPVEFITKLNNGEYFGTAEIKIVNYDSGGETYQKNDVAKFIEKNIKSSEDFDGMFV